MNAVLNQQPTPDAENVETPSGKWRSGENFPVGSFLIRRDLRVHVHAFYRFARNADNIADNPDLAPDAKIARLDRMAAILDGTSGDASPQLRWPRCWHFASLQVSFQCGEPAEMELFACVSVSRVFRNSRDAQPLDRMNTNCRDARENWSGVGS